MINRGWTLADLAQRTGARRRSLQLWADAGVIEAHRDTDRAGTGVHRLFSTREMQLAAILVPLAATGMPIGVLRHFAAVLRNAAEGEVPGADGYGEIADAFARAERREGQNYLLFAHVPPRDIWIAPITDASGPVCIDPEREFAQADLPRSAAIIILDVSKILGPLSAHSGEDKYIEEPKW